MKDETFPLYHNNQTNNSSNEPRQFNLHTSRGRRPSSRGYCPSSRAISTHLRGFGHGNAVNLENESIRERNILSETNETDTLNDSLENLSVGSGSTLSMVTVSPCKYDYSVNPKSDRPNLKRDSSLRDLDSRQYAFGSGNIGQFE